jgi:hypothetical protein
MAIDPAGVGLLGPIREMPDTGELADLVEEFHGRAPGKSFTAKRALGHRKKERAASPATLRSIGHNVKR